MRNDFLINTESACFVPDETAIKTANYTQKHRCTSTGSSDRSVSNLSHAEKIAQTQKLLDRAIAYAWYTVKSDRRLPVLTSMHWVRELAGSYHLTHSYLPLLEEAQDRFEKMGRKNLSQWAAHKAIEERGHDRLALLDIKSMGYKAEAVVQALIPPSVVVLVNYFARSVQAPDPIGCVGYAYTMERIATGINKKHIQLVEALLPPGICATRCLRLHSGIGSDVEHVKETVEIVAGLAYEEHIRVALACYETALLYFSPLKEDYISDEELKHALRPLELHRHLQGKVSIHAPHN
jgi:hypothetical protein